MIIIEGIFTTLKPSEGMVLTDGVVYSESGFLISSNDKVENYYEITAEEYKEILRLKEEELTLE